MRMHTIATTIVLTIVCTATIGYQAEFPTVKAGARTAAGPSLKPRRLIARAKSLELNTPYVPPPGDPLEHHTSGFAKIMCSRCSSPPRSSLRRRKCRILHQPLCERAKVGKPVIDRVNKAVHIRLPNGSRALPSTWRTRDA